MNSEPETNETKEVYTSQVEIKVPTDLIAEQGQDVKQYLAPRFIP